MRNKETKQFNKRLERKGLGFARVRLFTKSNIGKDYGDCQKESSCITFINKFIQLINSHTLWAKNIAKSRNSIEPLTRIVKSKNDNYTVPKVSYSVNRGGMSLKKDSPFGGFSVLLEHKKEQYKSNKKQRKGNYGEQINSSIIHNILLLDSLFLPALRGKFSSHNISNNNQCACNQKKRSPNLSTIDNLIKLFRSHCENRSNAIARIILNVANVNDFVKDKRSKLIKPGAINTTPNQAAERLPLMPESTLNNDFLTLPTLAKENSDVNEDE